MKRKVWNITVKDNPNRVVMGENDEFYTTDTEAYLVFNLDDKNFNPATAVLTLENRNDGSLKNETVDVVDGLIEWEMPQRYIEHFGNWQGQLVYYDPKEGVPEDAPEEDKFETYTSAPFTFVVNAHIGDKKKPSLVEIENWEKFIREGTELIETWEDLEALREENERQRQENYQELLDTGVLQTNINTKLEQLEEEYAPKLTEVTTQLAQKANKEDVFLKKNGININNFDEPTRQSFLEAQGIDVNYILGEGNVQPKNTSFYKRGKNLFDKSSALEDYYVSETTGEVIPSEGRFVSDFISVDASTEYTQHHANRVAFFNSNKEFVGGLPFLNNESRSFTTPDETAFLRVDLSKHYIDIYQLELGSQATPYEEFNIYIPADQLGEIPNRSIAEEKLDFDVVTRLEPKNLLFSETRKWDPLLSEGTELNGVITFTATARLGQYKRFIQNIENNHLIYVSANVKSSSNQVQLNAFKGGSGDNHFAKAHSGSGEYERLSGIALKTVENFNIRVIDYRSGDFDEIQFKDVLVVDLTADFGKGSEPTLEEFENIIINENNNNPYFKEKLGTNLIDAKLLNPPSGTESYKPPIYVKFENDVLNTISKYSETKDLRVQMKKHGGNNLFEFDGFYLIENDSQKVSTSHKSGDVLFGVGTDMFGPYQIRAVNNIDGDYTDGSQFTGGNHAFDGGSTGTPTARTSSVKVFLDGRELVENEGYGTQVDVYWTNFIQGSNTKKENGTGREVLKENIHIHYDGHKWAVDNIIEVLEDLNFSVYYGLQAPLSIYKGYIFYHNADNRKWNDASVNSNSESKDCNKVTVYKDNNWLDVELDLIGLGKKEFNKNVEHGAFVSGGKVYFNLVNGTNILNAGDTFSFKGAYRFYSK